MSHKNALSHPRFFEFLKCFSEAATSRNFLEAANKLNISQAALSVQLRQLEDCLPSPLFELRGKKKILTDFGTEFLIASRKTLHEAELKLTTILEGHLSEESLTLKVGCRPDYMSALQKKIQFKGNLEFTSLSGEEVAKAIQDKRIHLGITYMPPNLTDAVAIKAFKSGRVFICHPSQKPLDPLKCSSSWFLDHRAVTFENGHLLSDLLLEAKLKFGHLKKYLIVDSWRAAIDLVKNDPQSYAVVPEYMSEHLSGLKLHTLPYDKFKPLDFYYVFIKSLKKNPFYAKAIESLRQ